MKKILIVSLQYVHVIRWISVLKNVNNIEVYFFDCLDRGTVDELSWTNQISGWKKRKFPYFKGEYFLKKNIPSFYSLLSPFLELTASEQLSQIISDLKPDIVHSFEMQSQSIHLLESKKKFDFFWIYSCWGNDIYYYRNKKGFKKVKKVLSSVDLALADCQRDLELFTNYMDINKIYFHPLPGGGGYSFDNLPSNGYLEKKENLILIKGYQHEFGRALIVLDALENCHLLLKEFKIHVFSAHSEVISKALFLKHKYNLDIDFNSRLEKIPHSNFIKLFERAKIYIGNSVSDGIPNTLYEAILNGVICIQSNPGGATSEIIRDQIDGFLIQNPEDSEEISRHLISALNLSNDKLLNFENMRLRLMKTIEKEKVDNEILELYL